MEKYRPKIVIIKTMVVHTVSYFLIGVLAFFVMDYAAWLGGPIMRDFMRPVDHPMVTVAVLFQPLRGILFGFVFYALRDVFFNNNKGWRAAWLMLIVIGIFSTFGPAPGSIEGLVYTKIDFRSHLIGLPEILLQSFLLAFVTHHWLTDGNKRWLNVALWTTFAIVILMGIAGASSYLFVPQQRL